MSGDSRHNWDLIIDVFDVLEQHGYRRGDNQHTGRAVGLIGELARIYEGTQEQPAPAHPASTPPPRQPSSQARTPSAASSAEAIAGAEMHTILAALDEASDCKRDRAECCTDCAGQTCGTCQHRLDAARCYQSLAARLMGAMQSSVAQKPSPQPADETPQDRVQPDAAPDREAGQ